MLHAGQISKAFSGVRVLESVDLELRAGEVHALVGENGAGKSTLLKILAGVHQPDDGRITLDGAELRIPSPHAAARLGIALIHQEPQLFGDLSVAENVFLGHDLPRSRLGTIHWREMRRRTAETLASLGVNLDPRARVRGLSIADQQMVELAAALSQRARVLLMDEPTAALTPREVERLFEIMRRLRAEGRTIAFISHRLGEVFQISDRITVLRDGRLISCGPASQTTNDRVIREMVGRPLEALYERPASSHRESAQPPLLEVTGLSGSRFLDISFAVRPGEIVGLAGLVGAGRTDLARAIFGITTPDAGQIRIDGRATAIGSPRDAIAAGIAYLPEDRQQHGLFPPMSIASNTTAATLRAVAPAGLISNRRERQSAAGWAQRLQTRLRSLAQPARELSGGNQQKVVLAKWLSSAPRVLILDEPTRGIDVGAKAQVHRLVAELAAQGKAILMISSDLPEVLAMSDRLLVMREGRLAGEFARGEATQEAVMRAATGEDGSQGMEAQRHEGTMGKFEGGQGGAASPKGEQWSFGASTLDAGRSASHVQSAPFVAQSLPRFVASHLARFREGGIALVVLLTLLVGALIEPRLLSPQTLRGILLYIPIILVIALGQMTVIISRNIDLSVGSILGLAAIVVGHLYIDHPAMPLWLAAGLAAGVGGALGLFNGVLVALLRIPAIIATLGTLTAWRGLIFIYSGGRQVDNNYLPESLLNLSKTSPIGIPWIVLFATAVALAAAAFLRLTRTGREIYAIGSNPPAAYLRGIAVRRVLLIVFTLTGVLSGIAGLMYASRFGVVNPASAGAQMELIVISAVVIGGVNVFGGSGTVLGVVFGCLLLGIIYVGLPTLGVPGTWQVAIYGAAILSAATIDSLIQRRTSGVEVAA